MSQKESLDVRSQKAALQKTLLASAMSKAPAATGKIVNAYGQEEVCCARAPAPFTLSLSHRAREISRSCARARIAAKRELIASDAMSCTSR